MPSHSTGTWLKKAFGLRLDKWQRVQTNRRTIEDVSRLTRRQAIGMMAATPVAAQISAAADHSPSLSWLGGAAPSRQTGVSWGVPWARGAVKNGQQFSLAGSDGKPLPLQSWNLAYWPDGSVKWSGFATVAGPANAAEFRLSPGQPAEPSTPLRVTQNAGAIDIDTGRLKCRVGTQGAALVQSMTIEAREVARNGRLVCSLEDRSQPATLRYENFTSEIRKSTVEQHGPVRATIKIEGVHKAVNGPREWLPFVVRLYFYAGQEAVRIVHTIVFDGDDQKDFISGLGLVFEVPIREQVHNRHVRFTGEGDGMWAESTQPVSGRRALMIDGAERARQPGRRQAPSQQRTTAAARSDSADRLGRLGFLQAGAAQRRWLHHPQAHQSAELLAQLRSREARLGSGVRRRRIRRTGHRASVISGNPIRRRSRSEAPQATLPNCTRGCGRPTRLPWTCAITTPKPTAWMPPTKMSSPASARPTASRAPAN